MAAAPLSLTARRCACLPSASIRAWSCSASCSALCNRRQSNQQQRKARQKLRPASVQPMPMGPRPCQPQEELAAVLDTLEAKGFIQPERVAQSVLYRRAPKLGSQRVLQELRQKGLDEAIVRQAADTLRDTEHPRCWAVWQRKFGSAGQHAPGACPANTLFGQPGLCDGGDWQSGARAGTAQRMRPKIRRRR